MKPVRRIFRIAPTRRLAAAIAVASPLWLLPGAAGRVIAIAGVLALAGIVVAEWFRLPRRSDIALDREFPDTIGLGDRVEMRYVVSSRWKRPLFVTVADELPATFRGGASAESPAEVSLPANGRVTASTAVTGTRRGRFPLGRIGWRARTPLGLLAAYGMADSEEQVLVAPSVAGVRRFRMLAIQHKLHIAGMRELKRRGEGQSFAGLREYAVGDDPRHLDWKATARRGTLITREYSVEQSQILVTLIDAGRSMTQVAGEYPRFEHALSSALVLTDVAISAGDRVGTLVFDDEVRAFVPPQRGRAALGAVRQALIPVAATVTEPDYAAAFRHLAFHQRRRALIVFFTDVMDERSSRALVAHVMRSAARHLVLIVALRNDELMARAVPQQRRALAVYESAAAEELIAEREAALERMRRAGATVIDVSFTGMTAAVVNRYLELKARGAL